VCGTTCGSPGPYLTAELTLLAVAILTLALTIRLACYTGLIGSDDLDYAGYARQIAQHSYRLESYHPAVRYGLLLPVALVYRLFGVHEWTTVAVPLISSSLAAMLTALVAAELSGLSAGWISGLLMATFPLDVRYGSVLVPEPLLQVILVSGALLFVLAHRRNSVFLGAAAGFSFGISYLVKEPGIFFAIAFAVFALLQREWRLASSLLAGMALVIAAEMVWYWSQSGDLLFRLHALAIHNNDRTDNALREANEHLSYRLWQAYPRMMLRPNIDFGLHSLFALVLSAVAFLSWPSSKPVQLLLLWAALPFLYLNFGSSSLGFYWAIPALPRYITPIYPPLFIAAALAIVNAAKNDRVRRWLAGMATAAMCVVGVYCAITTRGTEYRTEHVRRLKEIAAVTLRDNSHICEFPMADGRRWRQVLQVIAPDRIGCSGATDLRLVPDSNGLPIVKPL
jgi:4-amino-4-deoxy-L-arabinose transferase-like glycosyltransferase